MKMEGLENASIEDLKRLLDHRKDSVDHWARQEGAELILKHEVEILDQIEDELDKRLRASDPWDECDPAGGYGLSSHV